MRLIFLLCFMLILSGCDSNPGLRSEPVPIAGTLKLPGGASTKDLTIGFSPTQQDSRPGGGKVAKDGTFQVLLSPGKYVVYFPEEANLQVPAYKAVPQAYRSPHQENEVTVSTSGITVELKQ